MGKIKEFICRPSEPLLTRAVHIFSLAVFVVGGVIFCYHLGESINFSLSFPNGSSLEGAVWMVQTSLLFLFLWMPAITFLSKFEKRMNVAVGIYTIGCVFAIMLSIASMVVIDEYLEPGAVRNEYQKLVAKSIKEDSKLPKAVLFTVESKECCGWKGAIDFGVSFKISDKVKTDYEFMKELEKCYGETWIVIKSKGTLKYEDGLKSSEEMLKGCNMFYKELFQRNCLLVFYFGLLVVFLGFIFVVLCVLRCKSFKKQEASASPSGVVLEDSSNNRLPTKDEVPPPPTNGKDDKTNPRPSVEPEDPEKFRMFSI